MNDMTKLTIFTASYNRADLIYRLYLTLKNQTCKDFEWLVVDDGSTDGTEELFLNKIIPDSQIDIRFFRNKTNLGLIRSLNFGVSNAIGEYFAKVDSDDYVVNDYVEYLCSLIDKLPDDKTIYGVAGLRVNSDGKPLKLSEPCFPNDSSYVLATDLERKKYNLDADMAEAWRTDVLRQFPFPVWKTEKFAPEQITFFDIALEGYRIVWTKKPLVICEYLEGGLTKGASQLEKQNPMGYSMMYNQRLKYEEGFINRAKTAAYFCALCHVGGNPTYCFKCTSKILGFFAFIPGWILSFRRRKQYSE